MTPAPVQILRMVSPIPFDGQSATGRGQSSTNHHQEWKRDGLKTSAKHCAFIFPPQQKKFNGQQEAPVGHWKHLVSLALWRHEGKASHYRLCGGFLSVFHRWDGLCGCSCYSLYWPWPVTTQKASRNSGNTGSQSCSPPQWPWSMAPQSLDAVLTGRLEKRIASIAQRKMLLVSNVHIQ